MHADYRRTTRGLHSSRTFKKNESSSQEDAEEAMCKIGQAVELTKGCMSNPLSMIPGHEAKRSEPAIRPEEDDQVNDR